MIGKLCSALCVTPNNSSKDVDATLSQFGSACAPAAIMFIEIGSCLLVSIIKTTVNASAIHSG